MSMHIYLKCKYIYENTGFCTLCIDNFKILKFFIKPSKFCTIFHRETSQPPTPQRPYDVLVDKIGYIVMLRARIFCSFLFCSAGIKKRNIRARNITK